MANQTTDRKKPYTIVSFGKNKNGKLMIELVLTSWIFKSRDKTVCKYPDVTSTDLDGLLEKKTNPKSSWKSYDCEELWGADNCEQGKRRLERCFMRDDYESTDCGKSLQKGNSIAKLSSKDAQDLLFNTAKMQLNAHSQGLKEKCSSPVSSDSSQESFKGAKQRKKRGKKTDSLKSIRVFSSSEDSETSQKLQSPGGKSQHKTSSDDSEIPVIEELKKKQHSSSLHKRRLGNHFSDDSCVQFFEQNLKDLQKHSDRQMRSMEHLESKIQELTTLFQTSLENLKRSIAYDIAKKNEELKVSIAELKSSGELRKTVASMMESFKDFDFPITTLEKFLELDNMLKQDQEKKSSMIELLEFYCTGLDDSQKCIIEVLPKIIQKNVQALYSGKGRVRKFHPVKKNFSMTELYLCFEAVVKNKYKDTNLIGRVGIWLGGAGDREGGRKNRDQ